MIQAIADRGKKVLRTFWSIVLCCLCLAGSVPAQTFRLEESRLPISELKGLWRFHTGDDPGWASPAFDDSTWSLLRSDRSWFDQGFKGYGGVAWYRFRAIIGANTGSLAIYIPALNDSFQIYANGHLIGQVGGMPPQPWRVISSNQLFRVPRAVIRPGEPIVFAIRVWRSPLTAPYSGAGSVAVPMIGDADRIAEWRTLQIERIFWELTDTNILMLVNLLTAILGLSLFVLRPTEREYLWYGSAQVMWTIHSIVAAVPRFLVLPYVSTYAIWLISFKAAAILNLEFFLALFRRSRGLVYWIGAICLASPVLLFPLTLRGWISISQFGFVNSCAFIPYAVVVPLLLFPRGREDKTEAWLLLAPFTLSAFSIAILNVIDVFRLVRYSWIAEFTARYTHLISSPFTLSAGALIGVLCNCAVGGVLILRFVRTRRDEERLAAELEAARAVQHVLVPDEIPSVPGYQIECIYRPAGQVGGDFFQIILLPGGDAIVAIGDVSGKGMPAAMTVSLLVGTLRTAVESDASPAALLAILNRALIGRSAGGFTTCLILHVASTGAITVANAGHLAPYLDGTELQIDNGLPLGLESATVYSETAFDLAPDKKLTLITDGVVEARSAGGELFGFERTRAISVEPAEKVAQAAEAFGQVDDITVLSVMRSQADQQPDSQREPASLGLAPA